MTESLGPHCDHFDWEDGPEEEERRRVREGVYGWSRSDRYEGARLRSALKVRRRSLYCILWGIGSQWSWMRTGVMCSLDLVQVIILAAVL